MQTNEKVKKGNIIRYVLGAFLLLGIVDNDAYPLITEICGVVFTLSILPCTWKLVKKVVPSIKKWQSIAVGVVLFFVFMFSTPETETEKILSENETTATTSAVETVTEMQTDETIPETTVEEQTTVEETTVEPTTIEETTTEKETEINYDMNVHFLDVEQGLAILVQSDGKNLVYDGGDRGTSSYVVAYLKKQGVEKIDYLISSHYDSDHVYGLIGCLSAFKVKNVISSDYEHDSQTYTKFINAVESAGLKCQHPEVGTEIKFGTGSFTVLGPASIDKNDSNSNSVVIKLTNGENSFIFTGDAESSSEKEMIATGIDLECNVLCLAHHGSATATSWDFLQATVPEYAVISCGAGNSYGHPHEEVMERLESMEIELFRTDLQGEVVAISDGKKIKWDMEPSKDYSPGEYEEETTKKKSSSSSGKSSKDDDSNSSSSSSGSQTYVWLPATGEKYHSVNDCGRMNPNTARQVTEDEAINRGYDACSKCN